MLPYVSLRPKYMSSYVTSSVLFLQFTTLSIYVVILQWCPPGRPTSSHGINDCLNSAGTPGTSVETEQTWPIASNQC